MKMVMKKLVWVKMMFNIIYIEEFGCVVLCGGVIGFSVINMICSVMGVNLEMFWFELCVEGYMMLGGYLLKVVKLIVFCMVMELVMMI